MREHLTSVRLPDTWEWRPLWQMTQPGRPITYGIVQAGPDVPAGVPYIRPVDMTDEHGIKPGVELRRTAPEIANAYRRSVVLEGDLVVTIGPSYGKVMTVPRELEGANLTQGTARVAVSPQLVCPRYLKLALRSQLVRDEWSTAIIGATFGGLNLGPLADTLIPVPPLEVQRRIADYLDTETARIDLALLKAEAVGDLINQRAAAVIDSPVPGEIVTDPLGVPMRLSGWDCPPLYTVAMVQKGFTKNSASEDADSAEKAYLRVANVQDGFLRLDEVRTVRLPPDDARRYELRPGDVLMTEGGDPDKLGRGTVWQGEIAGCLHQNHVFAVRPDHRRASAEYLALMTRTSYARMYFETTCSKTTGIASTSPTKIAAWRPPLPSRSEQDRIVADVADALRDLRRAQALLDRQEALLRERRQALITSAVTGEMEV